MAIKLSKLNINTNRKYFIITSDVVTFYPNIPIKQCIDTILYLYEEYINTLGKEPVNNQTFKELDIFIQCLRLGNTKLICQYKDKFYLQKKGLAMGVSSSPDLANLFGWYYERECNIINHPNVIFYGRYIDDCLGLVYADSEEDALQVLSILKIDTCTIEWNSSQTHQPFLDMLLYKDENNCLQHKPYRKAGSHQERIPWISHHPLDVKRGTFIGEMSRMATLCSSKSSYSESLHSLAALYITWGYPVDLVSHWLKDNYTERWTKRLAEKRTNSPEVLVLKSQFNTAWNYFNATQLGDVILGYWRDWIEHTEGGNFSTKFPTFNDNLGAMDPLPEYLLEVLDQRVGSFAPDIRKINILNRRMIVSRKRTRNLFNLTTLWKNRVITHMETDTLPEEPSPQVPYNPYKERMDSMAQELQDFDDLFEPWPVERRNLYAPTSTTYRSRPPRDRDLSPERTSSPFVAEFNWNLLARRSWVWLGNRWALTLNEHFAVLWVLRALTV